jgi:hypothetical protein
VEFGAAWEMEDLWPSGAALRGEASNRLHAALAEDCRGERCRKRHPRGVRWGSGRRSAVPVRGSLLTRRYTPLYDVKTGCLELARDEPGGCPLTGQVASGVEVT